tara:strand:+ start:66 stop:329 length:264 start_codon:yes stop_codon:yes gene_type:complete
MDEIEIKTEIQAHPDEPTSPVKLRMSQPPPPPPSPPSPYIYEDPPMPSDIRETAILLSSSFGVGVVVGGVLVYALFSRRGVQGCPME